MQFRQGDILIHGLRSFYGEDISPRATAKRSKIIGRGEKAGHTHTAVGDFKLYERGGTLYMRVGAGGATVEHPEHKSIGVPKGDYKIIQQREFVHGKSYSVTD